MEAPKRPTHHSKTHAHGSSRRFVTIRDNPTLFCGHLTKPRGSLMSTCYIDRMVTCTWNDPPEYPNECDMSDVSFNRTKDILGMDLGVFGASGETKKTKIDHRNRYAFCAEPASYEWTPSCMFVDKVTGHRCWPEKTEAVCWWDFHKFSWTPFPLPTDMHDMTPPFRRDESTKYPRNSRAISDHLQKKKDLMKNPFVWDDPSKPTLQFDCIGNFCGPSCAKAYALDRQMLQSIPLIHTVARMFGYIKTPVIPSESRMSDQEQDRDFDRVIPAPPRELLQMFTYQENTLTIDEFRRLCSCGITIKIRDPVFVSRKQIIEGEQAMADREIKLAELAVTNIGIPTKKAVVMHREDPNVTSRQTTAEIVRMNRPVKPIKGAKTLSSFTKK